MSIYNFPTAIRQVQGVYVPVVYTEGSVMSGQMYSECRMPRLGAGADLRWMVTFSGQCAPGPGFLLESEKGRACADSTAMQNTFTECTKVRYS